MRRNSDPDLIGGSGMAKKLDCSFKSAGIILRPQTGNGFWLGCLLPVALAINTFKHTVSASLDFKISTILAFGLACQTIGIWIALSAKDLPKIFHLLKLLPGLATAGLLIVCLNQEYAFAFFWGLTITVVYNFVYLITIRRLPKCFTVGEAALVVQGVVLFWAISIIQIHLWISMKEMTDMQQMTFIIQEALLAISIFAIIVAFIKFFRNLIPFLFLLLVTAAAIVLFPMNGKFAITVILNFIISDMRRICLIVMYIGFLGLSIAAVAYQLSNGNQASTKTRKIFHIIVVAVYVPGFIFECAFLYVLTGVALGAFIMFETVRLSRVAPEVLDNAVKIFIDEKDAGAVALTPIYLLVGCSIPLWLHPNPCDAVNATNAELLVLCAGLISVGVGDTVASFVGSSIGKHKIFGTSKSYEGLLANILSQGVAVILILLAARKELSYVTLTVPTIAILCNATVEAFTDQVDNLVLPLVTFIILTFDGIIPKS